MASLDPDQPSSGRNTADVRDVHTLLQVGSVSGDVNLGGTARPRRRALAYLRTVKEVFPGELVGREAELAELTKFSSQPEGPAYAWWRAEAWAGKSALMASFVLNPPAGIRIVSFFITARWSGHDHQGAFLDRILLQLAEITGEALPSVLNEADQQDWYRDLFVEAATRCADAGERLILVVDGLDEDRGIHPGTDAHSIAALLPNNPPAGSRIIVSGRPNPSIPDDVPPGHPLRDPAVVRDLARSRQAQVIQGFAQRDLDDLLTSAGPGKRLLGLITAAGGGLSAGDLSELTGEPAGLVEQLLTTIHGRAFAVRTQQWREPPQRLFVLAHEEIQRNAARYLAATELAAHRIRIAEWAAPYRALGWPDHTPEYLLSGYFWTLLETSDTNRALELVLDEQRHDLMLDVSGGDGAAVTEITTLQTLLAEQDRPDLHALLRLGQSREGLTGRNRNVPPALARVWAKLGQVARAEAVARSLPAQEQPAALLQTALAAGYPARARQLVEDAEALAFRLPRRVQFSPLQAMVDTLTDAHLFDEAEAIVRRAGDVLPENTSANLAAGMAEAGMLDRAHDLACSLQQADDFIYGCARVARAMALAGSPDRAWALVDTARARLTEIEDDYTKALALGQLNRVDPKDPRSGPLLDESATLLARLDAPGEQSLVLTDLVRALADSGDLRRAERVASGAESYARISALEQLAIAVAGNGDVDRARDYTSEAEALLTEITQPDYLASATYTVVHMLLKTNDVQRAEELALDIGNGHERSMALSGMAKALVAAGEPDRAVELVLRTDHPRQLALDLNSLVWTLTDHGEFDRAESVADAIADHDLRVAALAQIVSGLLPVDLDRARTLLREVEITARQPEPEERQRVHVRLAMAAAVIAEPDLVESLVEGLDDVVLDDCVFECASLLIAAGLPERAEALAALGGEPVRDQINAELAARRVLALDYDSGLAAARGLGSPLSRGRALVELVGMTPETLRADRLPLLNEAWEAAEVCPEAWQRDVVIAQLLVPRAIVGDYQRCLDVLRRMRYFDPWARGVIRVIESAVGNGDRSTAEEILDQFAESVTEFAEPTPFGDSMPNGHLIEAVAACGRFDEAEDLAGQVFRLFGSEDDEAMMRVIRQLIRQGHLGRAERLARSLANDDLRTGQLAEIALASPDGLREVIGYLLTEPSWSAGLMAVAQIDPAAIRLIAEHFIALND